MIAALSRAIAVSLFTGLATACFWTGDGDDLASGFESELYVDDLESPVAMASDPNGRVLVTEKNSGDVRLIDEQGRLKAEPVIHFEAASAGEWGLLGIALHPDFQANRLAYVYYMAPSVEGRSQPVVARFQIDGDVGRDPSIVVSDLPRTSITGASPEVDLFSNIHVGGNLHFGRDELLYVSIGDFGVFQQRSADPGEAIGKLLRFTAE
ncbi:MAG TPA: PQQ-dependent sugar dehydrogenase, partial [Dehalococcoidia bacterium]|nr:PQQ-dependent sugar dehydrogenase [Dehalococcoidia bacterium]